MNVLYVVAYKDNASKEFMVLMMPMPTVGKLDGVAPLKTDPPPTTLHHTLSIWLEMEFTSNIFLKTSICAHYSQTIFLKQLKSIFI